jgi:hypothetical protein
VGRRVGWVRGKSLGEGSGQYCHRTRATASHWRMSVWKSYLRRPAAWVSIRPAKHSGRRRRWTCHL